MSEALSSSPSPRLGRNGSSDGSLRAATARARSRSSRSASSRYSSSAEVSKISRCSEVDGLQQPRVDLGQRLLDRQLAGARALEQRRELEQLEVAHDGVRDVEVGVEAQLAEPAADLRDGRQQLVAQQPERRLQRLGGPEQLLLARLPLAADRRPRLLGERRRLLRRAAVGALRVGEHEPPARARHRDVQQPPHLGGVRRARERRDGLLEQRVGDRLERLPPRAGHPRAHQAEHVDVVELVALGVVHRHHPHAARRARRRPPPPRAARRRRRRRSSGRTRARWPAARGARRRRRARRSARGCAAARRPRSWPRTAAGGAARAARSAGARTGRAARSPARPRRSGRACRKMTIRSRASGGICGDSSAARQRRDHVELAPARDLGARARGRSPAARPAAARARARPRRRRPGRPAAAARPAGRGPRRAGRTPPRRTGGTAPRAPRRRRRPPGPRARTERTSTQTSSGATSSRAISRSTSAATACACARSLAQRQNATSPAAASAAVERLLEPVLDRRDDRLRRRQQPRAGAQRLVQPHDASPRPLGPEVADVLGRGAAEAVDRLVVVGERAELAVLGDQQPQQQALGEARVLQLVDEHVARSARRAARARAASRAAAGRRAGRGRRRRARPPRPAARRGRRTAPRTRARGAPRVVVAAATSAHAR